MPEYTEAETIVLFYFLSRGVSLRAIPHLLQSKCRTPFKTERQIDRYVARTQRTHAEDGYPELILRDRWDMDAVDHLIVIEARQAVGNAEFCQLISFGLVEEEIVHEWQGLGDSSLNVWELYVGYGALADWQREDEILEREARRQRDHDARHRFARSA